MEIRICVSSIILSVKKISETNKSINTKEKRREAAIKSTIRSSEYEGIKVSEEALRANLKEAKKSKNQ